mmetsp:Transcript_19914/g.56360  ORF Transcript_19914/g.56360 Transcript_19914/m.56360 type:complete len:483 (+) Transcript_19914:711-2159(+)|eukprot:CAMPEP_0119572054 /NCGR_PEP_ID=MMETSP1352-20130426/44428_1 /TAXON_ID=265584 /ORGANISM="Stauroneis constricta, Strain CCMP1120" /LENGTH=482 /DNA_ID=CAMNT_0007621737 /DNA_START=1585 /DNA_END=3033 /DNA_ORIENTATION=+
MNLTSINRSALMLLLLASSASTTDAWMMPSIQRVATTANTNTALSAIRKAGFGCSDAKSIDAAISESIALAKKEMASSNGGSGDDDITMAFISCAATQDVASIQKGFASRLPGVPMHGITSSGGILTKQKGLQENAVGCLLLSADAGDFVTSFDAEDAKRAVQQLEEKGSVFATEDSSTPYQAIFMSATPGMEEGVIDAIEDAFPGIPIYGGTAADNDLSGKWMVFGSGPDACGGTGISLVGISSNVELGASMIGPYTPTERTVTATKTEGRRVHELNGQPAADWVYNEWLGDEVKEAYENGGLILGQTAQRPIAFEVCVQNQEGKLGLRGRLRKLLSGRKKSTTPAAQPEYVTAHLAALGGPDEKFVDFFTPIPEGSELTIMDSGNGPSTGYTSALVNAYDVAASAMGSAKTPKAGILVYCGGMAIAVGDQLNDGLMSTLYQDRLKTMPMMGMTCFGEQTCLPQSKTNVQRNLSVGMVLFG